MARKFLSVKNELNGEKWVTGDGRTTTCISWIAPDNERTMRGAFVGGLLSAIASISAPRGRDFSVREMGCFGSFSVLQRPLQGTDAGWRGVL